jgi:hypothetical protein
MHPLLCMRISWALTVIPSVLIKPKLKKLIHIFIFEENMFCTSQEHRQAACQGTVALDLVTSVIY